MKTLLFLSLSLAVALGVPVLHPGEEQHSMKENQSPLLGDRLPAQGHVVVENPAPQVILSSEEHQEKVPPTKMKQSTELEVKVKREDEKEKKLKPDAEVKVEEAGKVEQEVRGDEDTGSQQEELVEAEVKMEQKLETDPELQIEPAVKVDAEVKEEVSTKKAKPEVKVWDFGAEEAEPEVQVDGKDEVMELQAEPDFKVESEMKVEPDVQMELEPEEEPLLAEAQEKPLVQMSLEREMNPGEKTGKWHTGMQGQYEDMGEPHMELEPLDDDSLFENEPSQHATFQRQSPVDLTEEEEMLMNERNRALNEERIMQMGAEMIEDPQQDQDLVLDATDLEDKTEVDMARQQMSFSENNFPEEDAGMEDWYKKQEDSADEDEYLMMLEEARRGPTGEENSPPQFFEEQQVEEEDPPMSQRSLMRGRPYNQEWRHCPGVLLEEKCYQFFKSPKKAADAEFFCQKHFPKGHLASITSQSIHKELMDLILRENGHYTRTWVGGIRYLDTNRFVWLDGSHWKYADWLSGEPNNTLNVEDCLEVLALGKGKFNDFTCWEPQPFICSYSYM